MNEGASEQASNGTTTVVLGSGIVMDEAQLSYKSVLFAEVSGNAKLHEKLGNTEALRAVERCMKRMERAVEAFGGRIVAQSNAELKAMFATADEASMAALEMQQRIADLPPISGVKLAVRVGFSFGQINGDDAATGELANAAARLTGLAKPGQILMGAQTYKALSPGLQLSTRSRELPSGASPTPIFELLALDSPLQPDEPHDSADETRKAVSQGSRLRLRYGDWLVVLDKRNPVVSMGRDLECDIVIHDRRASRRHVHVEWHEGNRFVLSDNSTNGTYVTIYGQPEIHLLREDCVIRDKGVICFATSANTPEADRVEFEQF